MKNILLFFITVFVCLCFFAFSFGQDLENHMKEIYGYDAWPGKTGEIKQEPPLDLLILPGLVLIDKTTGNDGTTYRWGKTPEKAQIAATVKTYAIIEGAQMGLLNILSQYSMILANSKKFGFTVGDAGFVIDENNFITFVAFVRNNITIVVKNVDVENPVSVEDITVQIDLMI